MWILYKINYSYGYEEISGVGIELLSSFTNELECREEYERLERKWRRR